MSVGVQIASSFIEGMASTGSGLALASEPAVKTAGGILVALAAVGRGILAATQEDPTEARLRLERLAELDRRMTRAELDADDAELLAKVRELYR